MTDTLLPKNDEELLSNRILSLVITAQRADIMHQATRSLESAEKIVQLIHARDTKMLERAELQGGVQILLEMNQRIADGEDLSFHTVLVELEEKLSKGESK